jgi:hypothetical protein
MGAGRQDPDNTYHKRGNQPNTLFQLVLNSVAVFQKTNESEKLLAIH